MSSKTEIVYSNDRTVTGEPVIKWMIRQLIESVDDVCLQAICPNSDAVIKASIRAAKEANAPLLFAATLNQVDVDGGYTGLTPGALASRIEQEADHVGFPGWNLACLDHGGPWLKDKHTRDGLSLDESMDAVKQSIEACLDASYALLHIDPTVDRTLPRGETVPIHLVVQRTLELIEHAESYRSQEGLAPVSYEVGTEEVHGGLADLQNFEDFLGGLDDGLRQRDLEHAWPCFVVGKVGTDLDTDFFDPEMAKRLTEKVRPYGALLKGHYTDNVRNPEDYPLSGMGGANIGPELTEVEYRALMELVDLEQKTGSESGLPEALKEAVVESGRWKKWLHDEEEGASFEELSAERQNWLVQTCSRYIWTQPSVKDARNRLYSNLDGVRQAETFVIWRIKEAIMEYYHAFNLIDFNDRLRALRAD